MKNVYVKPSAEYLDLLLTEDIAVGENGEIPGLSSSEDWGEW